jgi:acyl dehydratase
VTVVQMRELSHPPKNTELMLRAALPMIPGASRLPFVAGGGDEMPDTVLCLDAATLAAPRLAAYRDVCGFAGGETLPATAPHLLAFPLQMLLMTDGTFPVAPVGLVHLANRISQHRPVAVDEPLDLRVQATPLRSDARGRSFDLVSEARAGGELVWEERSTMLRRGQGGGEDDGARPTRRDRPLAVQEPGQTWRLPEDLGRRYGAVSGDRNPIHMHALAARLFGFPRAIAHGMWTKARCLAALSATLPDAYTVQVEFRRPILLPGAVSFASADEEHAISFAVRSGGDGSAQLHLRGEVVR